jgi:hypothetical protein
MTPTVLLPFRGDRQYQTIDHKGREQEIRRGIARHMAGSGRQQQREWTAKRLNLFGNIFPKPCISMDG